MAGRTLTAEDFDEKGGGNKGADTSDAIPADQKLDQEGKPIVEEPVKEGAEAEKVKKAEGGEEITPKPSDQFKPKHKTWEETERARVELERGFTQKSMREKELERELETFRKPSVTIPTMDDEIAKITDSALDQIGKITVEYDKDGRPTPEAIKKYNRESAIIWGKANREISRLEIQETTKQQDFHRTTVTKLYEGATKEGLKSDDELDMVGIAFDRTDPNLPLDTRVSNAVDSVKVRVTHLREGFVQSQERDKEEKDELKVLGRGSSRGKGAGKEEGKEDKKPSTMSDQLNQLHESRRLKKDDLY